MLASNLDLIVIALILIESQWNLNKINVVKKIDCAYSY